MRSFVLTYHSHRVLGSDYNSNDHIAFARDLAVVTEAGFKVVPLQRIVDAVKDEQAGTSNCELGNLVALTFDDGPAYDFANLVHPDFGYQRSFINIMRDFAAVRGEQCQPELHATSFVIASPSARELMEAAAEPEYSFLTPGSLDDQWWNEALDSGWVDIATHSWDHLHPSLPVVAHSLQCKGDFAKVETFDDGDSQILQATRYVNAKTGNRAAPFFAYPFGHHNEFLVSEYMPARQSLTGLQAAFTTEPRGVSVKEDIWALPRFVSGHHWRSPAELASLLNAK